MVRCTVLPLGEWRGEGGALFSRCSLLPVIKSPSEQEQLTLQKHEETQISSINRTDNISYPGVCVCVFFSSTSQTGAHFSVPTLITHGDLRRVTRVPAERGQQTARCLWKTRASLLSMSDQPASANAESALWDSHHQLLGWRKRGNVPLFLSFLLLVSFSPSLPLISYQRVTGSKQGKEKKDCEGDTRDQNLTREQGIGKETGKQ